MLVATVPAPRVATRQHTDASASELLAQVFSRPSFQPSRVAEAVGLVPPPRYPGQDVVSASTTVDRYPEYRKYRPERDRGDRIGHAWREGRSFYLEAGPGVLEVRAFDAARRDRALLREAEADLTSRTVANSWGGDLPDPVPSRSITHWSRKSRSRMVKAFGQRDWTGLADPARPLGMVTFTYPGNWLPWCPSGRAAKRHLALFRQRFARATGTRLDGAWKLEFQRPRADEHTDGRPNPSAGQQAPHFHLLMPCPAVVKGQRFEDWVRETWADVVGATGLDGEEHRKACTRVDLQAVAKFTDPRRLGIYFLKHGSKALDAKEYQHDVPQAWLCDEDGVIDPETGPGRFWGFWGLPKAVHAVEVDRDDFVVLRRELRKLDRARTYRICRDRRYWQLLRDGWSPREAGRISVLTTRTVRRRFMGVGGQLTGGFVMVESGAHLTRQLARLLKENRASAVTDSKPRGLPPGWWSVPWEDFRDLPSRLP